MNTGSKPCRAESGQLKPSFNKSAQNWLSTPQKAFPATEVAGENSGPRHDKHHVRLPFLRKTRTRHPELLAPVLLQGIRPLSAGTALYAWSGPGLARQAQGVVARGSVDGRGNPGREGGQVAGTFITTDAFLGRGRLRARKLRATMAPP